MPPRAPAAELPPFRPPAVPLVVHDPYFSVWSMADRLTDDVARHWTGAPKAMCGMLRLDGRPLRFAGPHPRSVPAMEQVSLQVFPTRTVYRFRAGGVALALTFASPLLPDDLDVLARPVTYVSFELRALDGRAHRAALYFDVAGEWAVDSPHQKVAWSRLKFPGLRVLRIGSQEQPVLEKSGDDLRIDWGHLYLAAPESAPGDSAAAGADRCRKGFAAAGRLPAQDDAGLPRPADRDAPVLACTFEFGRVGRAPAARHLLLAYDDEFSIEHLHRRLRPYWRRNGWGAAELLRAAEADHARLGRKCRAFDAALVADLRRAGGERYARLGALAYRQTVAAHKLVADLDGRPLFFSKENFSNGCIATVDVTYPSAPCFLLLAPELLEAQLVPVLDYAASPRWRFPFAPHDLGTYPLANGQVYGGGERTEENQMPVEECGNLLILAAALARATGRTALARRYWPLLTRWAEYLRAKGLRPENQLCTDDFAGHLEGNANLSVKAVVALGGYAQLAARLGRRSVARRYAALARRMAGQWRRLADDGDHTVLAFGRPGTWSQKYNLVWDRLLGLGLFPPEVARREVACYLRKLTRFGPPLDSRQTYTKLDWCVWSATLAASRADFEALLEPLYDWAHRSPSRVPLTDWYQTTDGRKVGFQARSVVGGIFIRMLADPKLWRKWAGRAGKR